MYAAAWLMAIALEVRMSLSTWMKSIKPKNYSHFDLRTSVEKASQYIQNKENIISHGFYPFLHFQKETKKYLGKNNQEESRRFKTKKRDLFYCAHIDRYIYSYYAYKLNVEFNKKVKSLGLENAVVAYRTDLKKCNIHFAKDAINFIKSNENCTVIVYDFEKFFDNIDHGYLKKMMCHLLESTILPLDYYAIFKNITKYSWWDLESIYRINGIQENKNKHCILNKRQRVLSKELFRKYKPKYLKTNINDYGIPQGSPISAVLSNIYLLHFDNEVNNMIKNLGGMYMRYSDDIIIIIPEMDGVNISKIIESIDKVCKTVPKLKIQEEKTKIFKVKKNNIIEFSKDCLNSGITNAKIDYLGYIYDGRSIRIREKSISRYYRKLHAKAKYIRKANGISKKGNKISNKNLYNKFSERGCKKGNTNYITYINNSKKIMPEEFICPTKNKHMGKIKRAIK